MNTEKLFNKSFTIITIGQFISLFGNSLQRFALSLMILDLTGSSLVFSIIIAVSFLPQILLSPFGGAFADRFSKKWIMVILDISSGVLLFGFYLLFSRIHAVSCVTIGALMFILTMIQSIYDPSVRASIPVITSKENLSAANSVVSIVSSVTGLLGPVAAGFLYGLYGIQTVLIINTVSFFLSAVMELFLLIPYTKRERHSNILHMFWSDIKDTLSYLFHEKPVIFKTILISTSINLFLAPIYSIGMPYMEKIIFGVSDELYGISEGIVGVGMILGALAAGVAAKKCPFTKLYNYFYVIIGLVVTMGFCALPFMLSIGETSYLSYGLFTACTFGYAGMLAIVNILCMTYLQTEIPVEYMGKSMALIMALSTALFPVGQVIFGGLYHVFASVTWVIYMIVALCTIIITLLMRGLIQKAFPVLEA